MLRFEIGTSLYQSRYRLSSFRWNNMQKRRRIHTRTGSPWKASKSMPYLSTAYLDDLAWRWLLFYMKRWLPSARWYAPSINAAYMPGHRPETAGGHTAHVEIKETSSKASCRFMTAHSWDCAPKAKRWEWARWWRWFLSASCFTEITRVTCPAARQAL